MADSSSNQNIINVKNSSGASASSKKVFTRKICRWCNNATCNVAFLQCGHQIMCDTCFNYYMPEVCPTCRHILTGTRTLTDGEEKERVISVQSIHPVLCSYCKKMEPLVLTLPCLHCNICFDCLADEAAQGVTICHQCNEEIVTARTSKRQVRELSAIINDEEQFLLEEDRQKFVQVAVVGSSLDLVAFILREFTSQGHFPVPEKIGNGTRFSPNCCYTNGIGMKMSAIEKINPSDTWPSDVSHLHPDFIVVAHDNLGEYRGNVANFHPWLVQDPLGDHIPILWMNFLGTQVQIVNTRDMQFVDDHGELRMRAHQHINLENIIEQIRQAFIVIYMTGRGRNYQEIGQVIESSSVG